MIRKISVIWLVGLFSWNVVFGAFGGLLLCLHQDSTMHLDAEPDLGSDCCMEEAAETEACISEGEACVDIELSAEVLPHSRPDEVRSLITYAPVFEVVAEVYEPVFTLREVAGIVQLRAPPDLRATSVLVAQTINLRV